MKTFEAPEAGGRFTRIQLEARRTSKDRTMNRYGTRGLSCG